MEKGGKGSSKVIISTWLIRGLFEAKWRTHAAAASIIRNISTLTKLFSSLGSANSSKFSLSSACVSNGLACRTYNFSQTLQSTRK